MVTKRTSLKPMKTHVPVIPMVSFSEWKGVGPREEPADPVYLENCRYTEVVK